MSVTWGNVLDVLAAVCLLGGASLSLAAGVGLLRFPDLLSRMHAATKPQVLGVMLMMLGLGLRLRNGPIIWMLVLVALFQMLTSPVSAHMVARAGYRTGKVRHDLLVVDELTRDLDEARTQIRADEERLERDRAEHERADQERADQDRADQERGGQERGGRERAGQQPADGERADGQSADEDRADLR